MLHRVLVATPGLAQRSLYTHVRDVLRPLAQWRSLGARVAVSQIVGRDTASSMNRASRPPHWKASQRVSTMAWSRRLLAVVGGLPGLFAYKAVNTADSLIGHREPRWRMFGWAAARADDVANLIPARIAGPLLALAGGGGLRVMWRDASNTPRRMRAGPKPRWPAHCDSARRTGAYDGVMHERPAFGAGASPRVSDLAEATDLYDACGLLWLLALALAIGARGSWPR